MAERIVGQLLLLPLPHSFLRVMLQTTEYKQQKCNIAIFILDSWFHMLCNYRVLVFVELL